MTTKYPHNVLEGFGNGALLDCRLRLAMNLLTYSPMFASPEAGTEPRRIAELALEVVEELFSQADARGWIDPLPDLAEIGPELRDQAKRTAEFQATQQVHGNMIGQSLMEAGQPKVIPVNPTPRGPGGRH